MKKSLLQFITIIPLALLLCLTFSCQQQGEQVAEEAKPAVDVKVDIAAINKVYHQYATGISTGDTDLWISLWIDDGVQMPPDESAITGKEQIRARVQSFFDKYIFKMTIDVEEVKVIGDWAFSRGTYTYSLTPKMEGEPYANIGKYLTILERQADGSWKFARDCFNNNERK